MQVNLKFDVALNVVILGRAMAATIFCISLALASRAIHNTGGLGGDAAWAGLTVIALPLAASFVIAVATEVLNALMSARGE